MGGGKKLCAALSSATFFSLVLGRFCHLLIKIFGLTHVTTLITVKIRLADSLYGLLCLNASSRDTDRVLRLWFMKYCNNEVCAFERVVSSGNIEI